MATIHINRGGTNLGTFSEEDVRAGLRSSRFLGTDLGWREGMAAWQPLSQFSEFQADLSSAPTPPLGSPPLSPPAAAAPEAVASTSVATLPAATSRGGLPWDRRHELGLFKAFLETLQMILTRPSDAFTTMKREGGLGEPILYALIGGSLGAIISLFFSFAFKSVGMFAHRGGLTSLVGLGAGSIALLFVIPVLVLVGLFIVSGLVHLCLILVGGARHSFETTFRTLSFAHGSTGVLQMVPVCGGLIACVWGLIVVCIGLARAHEIDTGKAILAVFLTFFLCCGGGVLLALLFGGLGAAAHNWH